MRSVSSGKTAIANLPPLVRQRRREIVDIARAHGADHVRLFGSAARGEIRRSSDIDILVRLQPGRTLLDMIAIKQDLEDLLHCEVDVVTEAAISPHIREQVLRESVSL